MAQEQIKGEQIIQPDWAANAIKSANDLDEALQKLIQHTGVLASDAKKVFPSADPKNLSELNAQNAAIEKSIDLQKQDIQTKILAQQANKRVRDEVLASLSAYSKLSREYRLASQAAKDMAAADILAGKAFSQTTKEAIFKANGLNEQLKKIDASMGNYTRNVGNYHGAVKALASGVGGLSGIMAMIGEALGINTEALQTLTNTSKELIKTSRELSHAKHLEAIAGEESTVATEVNTAATETNVVATEGATEATGLYGIALRGVAAISQATGLSMAASWALATGGITILIAGIASLVYYLNSAKDASEELAKQEAYRKDQAEREAEFLSVYDKEAIDNAETKIALLKKQGASIKEIHDAEQELLSLKIAQNKAEQEKLNTQTPDAENEKKLNTLLVEANKLKNEQLLLDTKEVDKKKELNKVSEDELDILLKFVHTSEELQKIQKDAQHDAAQSRTDKENLIVVTDNEAKAVKHLTSEYDRLNKTKAGLAGDSSGSPSALTQKEIDLQKKADAEKLENAKKLNDAIFKLAEDRVKAEQNLNKEQLSKIDEQLNQQFELLKNGQKNTYDFLLKEKAKALEEQAKLEKKARKEKEAEQLVNIFLEFLKADIAAGGGKNGFGAAAKALAQTALAKTLAEGLSGFYEGTEDTGSGGNIDSKGGMLAVLHPHERVLTAEQNAMIGSLSNEELVNSVFKYHIAEKKGIDMIKDNVIEEKLDQLISVVKNKKESSVEWKSLWIATQKVTEGGITNETTFINPPIIKRQQPFKN